MKWQCSTCRDWHDGFPASYSMPAPEPWVSLSQDEREAGLLGSDDCQLPNGRAFVLGNLPLHVIDADQPFAWGLWVELATPDYEKTIELWDTDGREELAPRFDGVVQTELTADSGLYPSTIGLEVDVLTQSRGSKPLLRLKNTKHPLVVEQECGISIDRVKAIASYVEHAHEKDSS